MKKFSIFAGLICAAILLIAQVPAPSSGTSTSLTLNGATNISAQLATNVNAVLDITLQKDFALAFGFHGDSAGTANVTAFFAPSTDGTTNTMDTTKGFALIAAANGGTAVVVTTNLPASVIAGYNYLILRYFTNAAATAVMTNVYVNYSNKRNAR